MIVIPMAGRSQRFFGAGYDLPKYMLPLGGQTVFDFAIGSFRALFSSEEFLIVARDVLNTPAFVEQSCRKLGLRNVTVVVLDAPTAGQAETVAVALQKSRRTSETPLTIFNIDTFRPGFELPEDSWMSSCDGYLEVFRGDGDNWSYVRPKRMGRPDVAETSEKKRISDLCCTGLYYFARADSFLRCLDAERSSPITTELYVAPLFNHLIAGGGRVFYKEIDRNHVVFCGVPEEYEALKASLG